MPNTLWRSTEKKYPEGQKDAFDPDLTQLLRQMTPDRMRTRAVDVRPWVSARTHHENHAALTSDEGGWCTE